MLTHPMLDQLAKLGLSGMTQAFAELEASGEGATLTHADWLGLLVDREMTHRRDKRLAARLRYARLRHQAVVEDIDYRAPRGLDRPLFHKLASGEWILTAGKAMRHAVEVGLDLDVIIDADPAQPPFCEGVGLAGQVSKMRAVEFLE